MLGLGEKIHVYSGNANPGLAQEIAEYLGLSLSEANITRFPDGETYCQYEENIRRSDVFLIQPTCAPTNDNLMELLIMIDTARRASAARITAVIPFYGYARQDRKDKPRVPLTAKLVANLLTQAGANRIVAVDLHAHQIQGFFDIPLDHLYCGPVLVPYLKEKLGSEAVVVAPDTGGVKMAQGYAERLDASLAIVAKHRISATEVQASHLVGDVAGKKCVLVDDMTSTAGTLISAAELLKKNGATEIYAAVSHCLLNEKGRQRLKDSCITELVTTNNVAVDNDCDGMVKVLSMAPVLGETIRRIHDGESVSDLFKY